MIKTKNVLLRAFGCAAVLVFASAFSAAAASFDIQELWADDASALAKATQPGLGFSFKYNGKSVGPEFSSEWRRATMADARSGVTVITLTHATGLIVTRELRELPDSNAIEYKVRFKNSAQKTLPAVSAIHALNISFDKSAAQGSCVISSGGGMADGFLPPRTFAMRKLCFAPTIPDGSRFDLTTEGGRSSNRDLPFFFVQNDARQEGLFVAFGWSGQWGALIQRNAQTGMLNIRGRIPDLEIALEPGEEIQGPTILIGTYRGVLADGSNQLRRIVRDVYTPKLAGKSFLPVAVYDTFYEVMDQFDEPLLMKLADGAAAIDQEYFLLDAGWYQGKSWFTSLGNWAHADKTKLPNGLGPVADHVRSKGLKFGLWFEPERVARGSQLAKEHPEWILWNYGNDVAPPWFTHVPWMSDLNDDSRAEFFSNSYGLLDYGRPEVQRWVMDLLDRYIREYDIKYIRYDLNMDPLPYWEANDKPGRRGVTQLRHIEGFYAIIDWLRERHPDTVMEGCASGGRRMDLETVRRFHTAFISDYSFDPSIVQFHLFGINHFLPGNYHYIQYVQPVAQARQENFQADALGFQSMFGGAFGTAGRVDLWSQEMKRRALLHVGIWKNLRRYLVEDYYALSPQPGDLESWSGWQFQDPDDQSGFVQTFRTATSDAAHRFVIHGLDAQAHYRFTEVYGSETFVVSGGAAMTKGVEVRQERNSSKIFTYEKVSGGDLSE